MRQLLDQGHKLVAEIGQRERGRLELEVTVTSEETGQMALALWDWAPEGFTLSARTPRLGTGRSPTPRQKQKRPLLKTAVKTGPEDEVSVASGENSAHG